jgi:hypothetical protein
MNCHSSSSLSGIPELQQLKKEENTQIFENQTESDIQARLQLLNKQYLKNKTIKLV